MRALESLEVCGLGDREFGKGTLFGCDKSEDDFGIRGSGSHEVGGNAVSGFVGFDPDVAV